VGYPGGVSDPKPAAKTTAPPLQPVAVVALALDRSADRRRLVEVRDQLHARDPAYAPGLWRDRMYRLDPTRNPALGHLVTQALVATRGGHDVGRLVAYQDLNHDLERGPGVGWFAAFDAADAGAARALFEAAAAWLRARGCRRAFGPWPLTRDAEPGLQAGPDAAHTMTGAADQGPGYGALLAASGLTVARRRHALRWRLARLGLDPESARVLAQAAEVAATTELRVRPVDTRRLADEVPALAQAHADSQRDAWGRAPAPEAAFAADLHELMRHALPELCLVAEWRGQPVGMALTLPDLNRILPRSGRLSPLARMRLPAASRGQGHGRLHDLWVTPDLAGRGIESLLVAETGQVARRLGLLEVETLGLDDDAGAARQALQRGGAEPDHAIEIWRMDLSRLAISKAISTEP